MDIQARILTLASKKVAKEASRKELAELNNLLRNDPEMKTVLKKVFDHWDHIHFNNTLSEKQIGENLALVLQKIHKQINGPTQGAGSSAEGK